MRRIVASFGGMALAMSLITPVAAAPSQQISDTESVLFCDGLTADAGTAFVFAAESESFGSFGDLTFWAAPATPESSPPTWISVTAAVDFDATSVSATFELVEFEPSENPEEPPFGDPVGTATLTASLTALGDPQEYDVRNRFGNQLTRRTGTIQDFAVSGELVLPTGITFDLSGCNAVVDSYTAFFNAPASFVGRFSSFVLDCHWEVDGTFVSIFAIAEEFGTFTDLFVSGPDLELFAVPTSEPILTTEAFAASFDLYDATGGTPDAVGSAEASASLTPGGRINERFSFGDFKVHITGQRYLVAGTLALELEGATHLLPMDDASCFAADQTVTEHVSPRQGPRAKPLANDAPDAAEPIAIGETVTVRTGGTAEEPEAPCVGEIGGEPIEIPIGHTAWWTFEGTGGEVTVDTAGSDFDTVVGIYVDDGTGLVGLGCVDDVDSLQARITVATEAGVTYYVQAGGFAGQSGTLVLSVN